MGAKMDMAVQSRLGTIWVRDLEWQIAAHHMK